MENLRKSAGSGLLWGVGATLVRDGAQFAAMLVLVRLLSPQMYGQAGLSLAVIVFISAFSFKSLAGHALQARDPGGVDWNRLFTAGLAINPLAFAVACAVAAGFWGFGQPVLAMVIGVYAVSFLVEIASTFHYTRLQAFHRWRRARLLLVAGAVTGPAAGIGLAYGGAGPVALAVMPSFAVLPLVVDFVLQRPFPRVVPRRLLSYRDGFAFGLNRGAAAALRGGANLAEQSILARLFGFALLGNYNRAVGLVQITSGRIGPLVMTTLYPVLTRAEVGSARFRRFGHILLVGVVWASVPSAVFLASEADAFVAILYGPNWSAVVPLLPLVTVLVALRALALTLDQLLVANTQQSVSLKIDTAMTIILIPLVIATPPFGMEVFLAAITAHAATTVALQMTFAVRGGGLDAKGLVHPVLAVLGASAVGLAAAAPLPPAGADLSGAAMLVARAAVFGLATVVVLRVVAGGPMALMVNALPLPAPLARLVGRLLRLRLRHEHNQ